MVVKNVFNIVSKSIKKSRSLRNGWYFGNVTNGMNEVCTNMALKKFVEINIIKHIET